MDPLWLARSKLRRGHLDETLEICDSLLLENPADSAAWFTKCKGVIKQNFIDDIELDEVSFAELLLDENAVASMPRPGTSLNASGGAEGKSSGAYDQGVRPVSSSGRPLTGFTRPGSSRPMSGATGDMRSALESSRRVGTASGGGGRPMTTLGREIRLGTASLTSQGANGGLVNLSKLNIKKYAQKPGLSMILVDYMLYVEHNNRKALEMSAEATEYHNFSNWWWKARLGKCYYKMGMLRDAEKQFKSSLKAQPAVDTYLELVNVYVRLDVPNTALDLLEQALDVFPTEPRLYLGLARLYEQLNEVDKAFFNYKKVLFYDASNVEAMACIGAHHFYAHQPELSMRYYRRLLQMGIDSAEIWNNIGLCCFYSSQYDMALNCFRKALHTAADEETAEVWYNIGHVAVALGDHGLAYQSFKVAAAVNPLHAEALNNLAVLEMRRYRTQETVKKSSSVAHAKNFLEASTEAGPHLFEAAFNRSLLAIEHDGVLQESHEYVFCYTVLPSFSCL
jgi:tetratricopeptide repeat protein 8